jgi:hypothetical protein
MELVSRLTRLSAATETSRAMTSAPDRMFFASIEGEGEEEPPVTHAAGVSFGGNGRRKEKSYAASRAIS